MQMRGPCSLASIAMDGAGDRNASADAVQEGFPELAIGDSDRALVGMTWYDAEDKQTYMFLGATWMNVGSIGGRLVPELIAFYASTEDKPRCELVGTDPRTMFEKGALWSRMDEVRTWVSEDVKQVGMTDRANDKDAKSEAWDSNPWCPFHDYHLVLYPRSAVPEEGSVIDIHGLGW